MVLREVEEERAEQDQAWGVGWGARGRRRVKTRDVVRLVYATRAANTAVVGEAMSPSV